MSINLNELRRVWHYSPDTGLFTRLIKTAYTVKIGNVANSINDKGYIKIKVSQVQKWLGQFETCEQAKNAYDEAAKLYFGEYARS